MRYSTLEECRDALVDLHGRKIGNRTLFVEYACETRQRLENEDDANDLPLDSNYKFRFNHFECVVLSKATA